MSTPSAEPEKRPGLLESPMCELILECISDAVLIIDLAGNPIYANRAARRVFDPLEAGLALLRPDGNICLLPDQATPYPQDQLPLARATRGESVDGVDIFLRCPGTQEGLWLSVSARPLRDLDGVPRGGIAVFRDITERRRLDEQLRQSQKMEAVGRLAGGVAHDFNNLLMIITGYSQMLLNDLGAQHSSRDNVREILNAAERAAGLTSQLLAFSRRIIIKPEQFDLNDAVLRMDKMLRRVLGEDIELVTLLSPELGRVSADPSQIEQLILTLALRAREAMPQGGKLIIETQNATLSREFLGNRLDVEPGPYVMLALSDTGEGLAPEARERLFEPGAGQGLFGLNAVAAIVRQSGGEIWVYSEPYEGTTFKTYLPRTDAARDQSVAAAEIPEPLAGNETVLLVEDEPGVRRLTQGMLRRYGYTVLEAGNGEEALRMYQQHSSPVDLLLTDVVMPLMGGRELAARLGALQPGLKVIFMSGYTDYALTQHGSLSPEMAFLQKPFTPDALARKVREAIDGQSQPHG